MLKTLPPTIFSQQAKVKCGEIFSHSFTDYTIYCTFCEMKSFKFEDFLLHIQNEHFVNNLLKTETLKFNCNHLLEVNVKNENTTEDKNTILCEDLEQPYEEDDIDNNDLNDENSYDEVPIAILKKKEKITTKKRKKTNPSRLNDIEEHNDHSSDEEFKPLINKLKPAVGLNLKKSSKNLKRPKTHTTSPVQDENPKVKSKKKATIEHKCPECEEIFIHLKQLDRHVFEFHGGYKCSMCDKRFRRRPHLVGHEKTHTAEKKFNCPVKKCGRAFTEEEYLKRHLEVHTMECTFICDFENCGKSFQTQRRLTIHTYTHRKPKKFVCDACGYSCRANITLMIHQRVHTGEKPFGCEVCEKRFVSKTALTEHMLTHSNTRPHLCQICNASFANRRVLQKHILIHSDERKYKCKFCDSAFKQATGLDGHMRRLHRAPKSTIIAVPLESSLF